MTEKDRRQAGQSNYENAQQHGKPAKHKFRHSPAGLFQPFSGITNTLPEDVFHFANIFGYQNSVVQIAQGFPQSCHLSLPSMATICISPAVQSGINDQAPEIVETYNLVIPVSAVRSRIRQEFERHRYVQELQVIDVLLFKGLVEYQVYLLSEEGC